MKIEYDPTRDLLYIWFSMVSTKAAQTITVVPGIHADLDASGKLIGLDAAEVLGEKLQFEVSLPSLEVVGSSE